MLNFLSVAFHVFLECGIRHCLSPWPVHVPLFLCLVDTGYLWHSITTVCIVATYGIVEIVFILKIMGVLSCICLLVQHIDYAALV